MRGVGHRKIRSFERSITRKFTWMIRGRVKIENAVEKSAPISPWMKERKINTNYFSLNAYF
jgi:hypothetical protein